MTKTIETQNHVIHIDKFMDLVYVQISTKDDFVKDVLDNIIIHSKNGRN